MSVRKTSEAQREAARRNGSKSRGPITPEGKRKSANARRAKSPLIACHSSIVGTESPEDFLEYVKIYTLRLQPRDEVELRLIQQIAACETRYERTCAIESAALSLRAGLEPDLVGLVSITFATRNVLNHDGQFLPYLNRLQRQLRSEINSLLRQFTALRKNFPILTQPQQVFSPQPVIVPLEEVLDSGRIPQPAGNNQPATPINPSLPTSQYPADALRLPLARHFDPAA